MSEKPQPPRVFVDPDFVKAAQAHMGGAVPERISVSDALLDQLRCLPRHMARTLLWQLILAAETEGARKLSKGEAQSLRDFPVLVAIENGTYRGQSEKADRRQEQRLRKKLGLERRPAGRKNNHDEND
jgi:hypothetical protein